MVCRGLYNPSMSELFPKLSLMLLSSDPEICEWLFADLETIGEKTEKNGFLFGGVDLEVSLVKEPGEIKTGEVDIVLGLIRYVDMVSLKALGELIKAVADVKHCPSSVMVYRKEQEGDFKMSCPYCGQKIWVRDADQDKRGRCPNCHKGFTLPCQLDHVARALQLPFSVSVRKAVQGDGSALAAQLKHLLRVRADEINLRLAGDMPLRSSGETMNVNLDTGPISGADA